MSRAWDAMLADQSGQKRPKNVYSRRPSAMMRDTPHEGHEEEEHEQPDEEVDASPATPLQDIEPIELPRQATRPKKKKNAGSPPKSGKGKGKASEAQAAAPPNPGPGGGGGAGGRPPPRRPPVSVKKPKKRRRDYGSYAAYIYRVLKRVHPEQGISRRAMAIVNDMVVDVQGRLGAESARLVRCNKRQTMTSREVETAVRLLLPGELARHAVSEGTKAVVKYNASWAQPPKGR